MNIRRLLALAFCLALMFSLASCGKCKAHVDKDDDYKCDNCGEDYDDGDEAPSTPCATVKFTLRLDTGESIPGVTFTLTRSDEKVYELTTGADGTVTILIEVGAYYLDCSNLPENCILETPGVKIKEDTTSAELVAINNTPDGSQKKPFFISENENQVLLAPGQEIFYICHASSVRYIKVYNEQITITYDGDTYEAQDGCVEVLLKAVSGGHAEFSLKNNSNDEILTTFYVEAPLGSRDNPIEISGNSLDVYLSTDSVIYYSWTAERDGVLVVERPVQGVDISLTKNLEGNVPVQSDTSENGVASMVVSAGDVIKIEISVNSEKVGDLTQTQISFIIQ